MSPENFTNADNSIIFSEIFRDVILQNNLPLLVMFAFHVLCGQFNS